MRRTQRTLPAAAMLVAIAAAVAFFFVAPSEALAAPLTALVSSGFDPLSLAVEANLALAGLRAAQTDLVARAAAKQAELKDDTSAEDARRIQDEHAALVRDIEANADQIRAAEAAAELARRNQPAPTASQPDASAIATAVAEGLRADRERVAGIHDLARQAGMDVTGEPVRAAVGGNVTVDAFRAQAFTFMAERARQTATNPVSPSRIEFGRDERDGVRSAMSAALAARFEVRANPRARVEVAEAARGYMEMGLAELAAEAIGYRGHLRTVHQVEQVFERAFHTTSDFPAIFGNALNMRLLARYQMASPAYRRFAAFYTATDLRPTPVIRAGDFPSLQPVSEAGEIKAGSFSESKETFQVFPYGVTFNLSRHMLVNDQLGAIDQVLGSTGDRVADWENAQVFAKLAANPALATDSVAVFHASHGNLPTAAAISVASVGAARAAMMKQTTLDGLKANFQPRTLLCGPDKITEAEQLFATIIPTQQANAVPESLRRLEPVADANVAGNAWYLFADPAIAPVFVYGYLEGFTGPRLSMKDHWSVQGVGVKLEHDFGSAAIDYRGGVRNAGA